MCYPFPIFNKVLVSSYSFIYFNESISIKNIEFTSKLVCLNEYFDTIWELKGYNIESLKIIKIYNRILIFIGTTKGELIVIDEQTGTILLIIYNSSCVNMIQLLTDTGLLLSCYDDGTISAHNLEDVLI